jgi:hypothetical protein
MILDDETRLAERRVIKVDTRIVIFIYNMI